MERDFSFEALAEATNASISSERGALNKALKQIREASPELDDEDLAMLIQIRADQYRRAWPDMSLTPTALAKHWGRIQEEAKPAPVANAPMVTGDCPDCEGDRLVLVGYRPPTGENPHPTEPGFEQYAPCPSCNSGANADFFRADGSRFRCPDPARVRELMRG